MLTLTGANEIGTLSDQDVLYSFFLSRCSDTPGANPRSGRRDGGRDQGRQSDRQGSR